jgi:hypothetical protein
MLISQKNAQDSSGPKTPEGKAAVHLNALTYGLRIRSTILSDENAADYSRLWDELETNWQPQDRIERCYLETMAASQWLLALVAQSEQKVYMFIEFGEKQFAVLASVSKQRAQLERSFRTAGEDMEQSQKDRQAAPRICDGRWRRVLPGPVLPHHARHSLATCPQIINCWTSQLPASNGVYYVYSAI